MSISKFNHQVLRSTCNESGWRDREQLRLTKRARILVIRFCGRANKAFVRGADSWIMLGCCFMRKQVNNWIFRAHDGAMRKWAVNSLNSRRSIIWSATPMLCLSSLRLKLREKAGQWRWRCQWPSSELSSPERKRERFARTILVVSQEWKATGNFSSQRKEWPSIPVKCITNEIMRIRSRSRISIGFRTTSSPTARMFLKD